MPEQEYPVGALKTNGKEGAEKIVAIRSELPSPRDWGYMSTANGGGYLSHAEVEGWLDA